MHVLVVHAHPKSKSLSRAVLDEFVRGLGDAGHTFEVLDLYETNFNPIIGVQDLAWCIGHDLPPDLIERMDPKQMVLDNAGGPLQRLMARWWLRNKSTAEAIDLIASRRPKDVVEQHEKVARAQGLVFISPLYWMNFPTMMKGWLERVFSYGFAYELTAEGWKGHMTGRVPLLKHEKALILSTAFFSEEDCRNSGVTDAMRTLMDEWGLKYPGVKEVEHVFFHSVWGVDDATIQGYLQRSYDLGLSF